MDLKRLLGIREPSKTIPYAFTNNETISAPEKIEKPEKTEDEWIWVEGYKGTDKDMKCLDFQYELLKPFDLEEPEKIDECFYGFHLCRDFEDVLRYYSLSKGNRFFKVKALVSKKDYEDYGVTHYNMNSMYGFPSCRNKLVAKSIIFISELTTDEIFEIIEFKDGKDWPTEDKELARLKGVTFVREEIFVRELISLGYSRPFAELLRKDGKFEIAKAVGSQEDLSMDMKVAYIMRGVK